MTVPGNSLPSEQGQPLAVFTRQVQSVRELLEFDLFVLEHIVGGLDGIAEGLERRNFHNDATAVRNRLSAVRNIRNSGSFRPRYETIFNQCIVLLVSYFGSTVGELFRQAVAEALASNIDVPVAKESVEVDWKTLSGVAESHPALVARLVVSKQKISFQDMGGIVRAFEKNLGITLERGLVVNDIILGQAARHAIVHSGAIVDGQMTHQIRDAAPRSLKTDVVVGEPISFQPEEVNLLANQMIAFVSQVTERVDSMLSFPKEQRSDIGAI
jgi:hypothetical protein